MDNQKKLDKVLDLLEEQNIKSENIEKLLKAVLVNNILDEIYRIEADNVDINCPETRKVLDKTIVEMIEQNGLQPRSLETIRETCFLFIDVPRDLKITVSSLASLVKACNTIDDSFSMCFCFKKCIESQKTRLHEEQISFCVDDKELHIFIR